MAAVVAVTKARGMEVAGAVDTHFVGEDIGKVIIYFSHSHSVSTLLRTNSILHLPISLCSSVTWKSHWKYP